MKNTSSFKFLDSRLRRGYNTDNESDLESEGGDKGSSYNYFESIDDESLGAPFINSSHDALSELEDEFATFNSFQNDNELERHSRPTELTNLAVCFGDMTMAYISSPQASSVANKSEMQANKNDNTPKLSTNSALVSSLDISMSLDQDSTMQNVQVAAFTPNLQAQSSQENITYVNSTQAPRRDVEKRSLDEKLDSVCAPSPPNKKQHR
jgi:hypothetical protein